MSVLGVGGILASVCRTSMMKRTKGAYLVFLYPSLAGVPKEVAVGALGVSVGINALIDLESG